MNEADVRERLERLVDEMVERGILFDDAVGAFERAFIVKVLDRVDGNVTVAAKELRIHRNTLSRKITEHKIRR
jgi:Fis family transcriptional regulator, factor for inversion stimulation protein